MTIEEILTAYKVQSESYDTIISEAETVEDLYTKTKPVIEAIGKLFSDLCDQLENDREAIDALLMEHCLSYPEDYGDALEYERMKINGEFDDAEVIDMDDDYGDHEDIKDDGENDDLPFW